MHIIDWIKNNFRRDSLKTPTYFKDGQLIFKEGKGAQSILGDRLIINPNKLKNISSFIEKNGIKSITINPSYFRVNSLDFLKDIPFIEGVYLLQTDLDLSPLDNLTNLKVFTVDRINKPFDFSKFQRLEVLGTTYNKNTINIGLCTNLFWLWLDNFNKTDLHEIKALKNLQYLSLFKTGITNLKGLEGLENLNELHIDSASNLVSLEGISINNKQIEIIDIFGAKNLTDYSAITECKSIKKVRFGKTGETKNILFLKSLPKLESGIIGMKVVDGDMIYLKTLSEAGFVDYPHYNVKMKDLKNNAT